MSAVAQSNTPVVVISNTPLAAELPIAIAAASNALREVWRGSIGSVGSGALEIVARGTKRNI